MTRSYPNTPIVGVGIVIFNDEKKVLLVKRGKEPSKGLWSIPGGMVELGERVRDAGIREVKEECNVDVEPEDVIAVVDLIFKDQDEKVKYHYILIDYLAKFISGELRPQSDVVDARWFSQQELEELDIPEVTRNVLEKVYKSQIEVPTDL